MMSAQPPDDLLEAYLLGELTPEQERMLLHPAEIPSWQEELVLARRLRTALRAQPRQHVLPQSVVMPESLSPEPLPPALQGRLLAIMQEASPPLELPASLQARLEEQCTRARPSPLPTPATPEQQRPPPWAAWVERWVHAPLRTWLEHLRLLHWQLSAGLVAALLLWGLLPLLRPLEPEVVLKGGPTSPALLRPQASLNLVAQDRPAGPVYRLALEELSPGVWGASIRRDQTLQPVLLSRDVDLSAQDRYAWVVGVTEAGKLLPLGTPRLEKLERLPQTEHLYALPLPLELSGLPETSLRLRLHVLLTETPVTREQLEKLAAARNASQLVRPTLLLDALPEVKGLEATLLLEVP